MKKSMAVLFRKKNMADIRALHHSTKLLTFVPKNSVRNVFISFAFSTIDIVFIAIFLCFLCTTDSVLTVRLNGIIAVVGCPHLVPILLHILAQ